MAFWRRDGFGVSRDPVDWFIPFRARGVDEEA